MRYARPGRKLLYAMAGMVVCLAGCAGKGDAAVNADMPTQTSADPTADIVTSVSHDTTNVSYSAAEAPRVVTDFSDVAGEVILPDGGTVLKEEAFAACDEKFLLCYGVGSGVGPEAGSDDTENTVAAYVEENGLESVAVLYPVEPIIRFHDEVITLTSEVKNFFYGEDVDYESEKWCSWEQNENAPNFGYEDWQAPGCSSWCGVDYFEQKAEASSELPSGTGRYEASNVLVQNREKAWAEGAEGPGIGESITYYQACDVYGNNVENSVLNEITWDDREPEHDGLMRYTEICIVNGYAKDLKTWEENGRIKRLIMYIDDRAYANLELEDTILPQYFTLPEDDIIVMNGNALTVRFEIADVYPGTLYEDTCLTGLVMEFAGRYAH